MPPPPPTTSHLLHGTLDALVLKTLASGPRHGYAIARLLEDATQGSLSIEEGSLYPSLYRMERKGLLDAEWVTSQTGRRTKVYRLTASGRARLRAETAAWLQFSAAVSRVLLAPA